MGKRWVTVRSFVLVTNLFQQQPHKMHESAELSAYDILETWPYQPQEPHEQGKGDEAA